MVVNMNMRGAGEGNINQYLADTISQVFGEVCTVDVAGTTNRELFASDNPRMLENLAENGAKLEDEELSRMMDRVERNLTPYEAGDYILPTTRRPWSFWGCRLSTG